MRRGRSSREEVVFTKDKEFLKGLSFVVPPQVVRSGGRKEGGLGVKMVGGEVFGHLQIKTCLERNC